MSTLSRRRLIQGSAALALAAATGGLSGCGSQTSISEDPNELVLWYWNRSIAPTLIAKAAEEINGTGKRLRADLIGSGFDTKLRTSLAGNSNIPDVSAINSNCSLYFTNEQRFTDLNELGAADYAGDYFDWKWKLGTTPTGRQCFWPMDTGPTGLYYRNDIFEKAGLPSEPEEVGAAIRTWDELIELGTKLRKDADVALISTGFMIMNQFLNASPERWFDASDKPLYSEPDSAVRQAWDTAVKAIKAGITGNLQTGTDRNSAWVSGKTAGHIEAVWWAEVLKDTAPETEGKWRLASQPGNPGNSGGSFLTIPSTSKDPEAAFAFIRWLTSPESQAVSFNEVQLFPSTPASFTGGGMKGAGSFFGPQDSLEFFSKAAESVPTTYVSPYENQVSAFTTQLTNVEAGKDSEQAWDEALTLTNRVVKKRGLI